MRCCMDFCLILRGSVQRHRRHPRELPEQCHVNLSIWSKMGIRTVFTLCNASPIIGIVASLIGWPKQILTVFIMKHVTLFLL